MSTHNVYPSEIERPAASSSAKLLACAALSVAITLLTFTTIANSASAAANASQVPAAALMAAN